MDAIHRLEELTFPELDALDRDRTVVIFAVSPLEEHGPHLPLGVDAFTADYFARAMAERITAERPGWSVVLAPALHLGSWLVEAPGSVRIRQRTLRNLLIEYGSSLARHGFKYLLISTGHAGPGHLVALEEAARAVSRRFAVSMASFTGRLAHDFWRGKLQAEIERYLARPLTDEEREALRDDRHAGKWETSMILWLRPELVREGYRDLPPSRFPLRQRLTPHYPVRHGNRLGYIGSPALANAEFAQASARALLDAAMALVNPFLDGQVRAKQTHSVFYRIPIFRTNFWRYLVAGAIVLAGLLVLYFRTR